MTRRRTVVNEQTSLSPDKKIVGLQIFLAGPVTRDLDRELDINLAAERALFFSKENATQRYIDSGRHHENNWKTKEGGVGRKNEIFPALAPIVTRQPWNHFWTRPNSLSVSGSKSFALRNTPVLHATYSFFIFTTE